MIFIQAREFATRLGRVVVGENEIKARQVLDTVTTLMDLQEDDAGDKIWWAHCFGGVLEFITDKTFSLDHDIDIGVIYGECGDRKLINAFEGYGYRADIKIVNDINNRPLNIHFIPKEDGIKGLPTIDVYFWVHVDDKYYHTYDIKKEGNRVPSEYIFKGVKEEWFTPHKNVVAAERSVGKPGRERMLTAQGTWNFPAFGEGSGLTMRVPYAIGHLLDTWYGKTWAFREYYRGQSMSPWVKRVKSCKDLI